jgi:aspartyl-tRNA synthetase
LEGKDIEKIQAQQYDITLCGQEIGWWSIRAHLPEILKSTYKVMKYSDEEIQHSIWPMLDAFSYGVPPHGWIALGIDRIIMILQQEKSLREVIAFPKTWSAEDLLFEAPSSLSGKTLSDVHIKVESYITTQGR